MERWVKGELPGIECWSYTYFASAKIPPEPRSHAYRIPILRSLVIPNQVPAAGLPRSLPHSTHGSSSALTFSASFLSVVPSMAACIDGRGGTSPEPMTESGCGDCSNLCH